jgi:hypothetical protein
MSGSLTAVAKEVARCKLHLVSVQEVRWDKGGTVRDRDCNFFYGRGNEKSSIWNKIFTHYRLVSAVNRVEFVNGRMSYIVLRARWCNVIVLNVHAPNEEKSDDSKENFCGELEQDFDHFPKYHMKILLGYFNAKARIENIFKPTMWNESMHQ